MRLEIGTERPWAAHGQSLSRAHLLIETHDRTSIKRRLCINLVNQTPFGFGAGMLSLRFRSFSLTSNFELLFF